MQTILIAVLAAATAAVIAWVIQELRNKNRTSALKEEQHDSELEHTQQVATLQARLSEQQNLQDFLENAKEQMGTTFQASASKALQNSSEQFLTLANQNMAKTIEEAKAEFNLRHQSFQDLVKPLADNYNKLDPKLDQIVQHSTQVASAADRLSSALNDNRRIGSWGEIQLRRIIELSGMTEYCDFSEQQTSSTGNERPDLTVHLPEDRAIVIDAKASTKAYLEAQQAENEQDASQALTRHAAAIRHQVDDLASKKYGQKVQGSLDFVIMFVPGDQFLSAALSANPDIIEYAIAHRVAIATPASLISLLWAVANGWQRHRMAQEAEVLLEIGNEMHKRLNTFMEHYSATGRRLTSLVDSYNASVQSFDSRLMPQARRFSDIIAKDEQALQAPLMVDKAPNSSRYAPALPESG